MSKGEDLTKKFNGVGLNNDKSPDGSRKSGEGYGTNMSRRDFVLKQAQPNVKRAGAGSKKIVGKKTDAPSNKAPRIQSTPERSTRARAIPPEPTPSPTQPIKPSPPRSAPPANDGEHDNANRTPSTGSAKKSLEGQVSESSEDQGAIEEDEEVVRRSSSENDRGAESNGASDADPSVSPSKTNPTKQVDSTSSYRDDSEKDSIMKSPTTSPSSLATSLVESLTQSPAWQDLATKMDLNRQQEAALNAARVDAKTEAQVNSIVDRLGALEIEKEELKRDFSDLKGRLIVGSLFGMERAFEGAKTGVAANRSL